MADAPDVEGYTFLGWGPTATGPGGGWHIRSDLVARCHRCGDLIDLWSEVDENCRCGRLFKDASAGRFGHSDGDASIAIYRQT